MKKTFKLQDLDCANCAAKMERAIQQVEGVISRQRQLHDPEAFHRNRRRKLRQRLERSEEKGKES